MPTVAPTFDDALAFTLRAEGGYANVAGDRGGATNRGITQGTYDHWRAGRGLEPRDVRSIEDREIWTIYLTEYWQPSGCETLPPRIALAHFDAVVLHGPRNAAAFLQRAVWVDDDRIVGAATAAAASAQDPALVIYAMLSFRQAFCRTLAQQPDQKRFLAGWLNRCRAVWDRVGPKLLT